MKKVLTPLFAAGLFCSVAGAQVIQNEVVATAGDFFSSPAASLDWTLGEPVVETWTNGATLSQGFHQAFDLATPVFERPYSDIEIKVFPNPATNWLIIETDAGQPLTALVYDLYGHQLLAAGIGQTEKFDISAWPPGSYLISVADEAGPVQTFKFHKVRF